jgi:Zn-dependent protease/CBS domain-containing protein
MGSSFKIGRIAGIDIGINYSWILAFFLIAWSFAAGVFPVLAPNQSAAAYWIAGFIEAGLMFICVLLHELAHSLVARSRGLPVSSITLFIFGGVSNLSEEPEKASTEFVMAFVGPLTSLVLSGILYLVFLVYPAQNSLPGVTIFYLAYINLSLGLFNLIPGFPLDGGRVLRSIIWGATHNLVTATNIASAIGQIVGGIFIGIGILLAFSNNLLNGLWIAFIGWFLYSAAESSRRELTMREALRGVHVKDVMDPSPACTSPETPVNDVVQQVFFRAGYRAAPVCVSDKLEGIVTITDVKKIRQDEWATTPVSRIMTRDPIYQVKAEDDLGEAVKILGAHDLNQLIVMDNGHLAGMLNRAHVIRYLQLKQELATQPKRAKTARPAGGTTTTPVGMPPSSGMTPPNNAPPTETSGTPGSQQGTPTGTAGGPASRS